jgi:poly(3-hydroxybutyrate) depolymerase
MGLRSQGILLLGAVGLLVCGVAFQRGKARPVPGVSGSTQTGTLSASLDVGGRVRTYLFHVPPTDDVKTPLPLVFVLHGATQSADSAEKMSGMSARRTGSASLWPIPLARAVCRHGTREIAAVTQSGTASTTQAFSARC